MRWGRLPGGTGAGPPWCFLLMEPSEPGEPNNQLCCKGDANPAAGRSAGLDRIPRNHFVLLSGCERLHEAGWGAVA